MLDEDSVRGALIVVVGVSTGLSFRSTGKDWCDTEWGRRLVSGVERKGTGGVGDINYRGRTRFY